MRKIRVITISRQIGSKGFDIGKLVAEQLGWSFTCREAITQAAALASAPQAALAMIDELHLLGLNLSTEENQAYHSAIAHVMDDLAEKGNVVIVGRAGQVILANRPDTFHIRIIAPAEIRAQRLMEKHHISISAAKAQVSASDRYRNGYFKRFYNANCNDPLLYDMVLNTARITVAEAAALINRQVVTEA